MNGGNADISYSNLVQTGDDAQELAGAVRDDDVAADGVVHVDRLRFARLPRARDEAASEILV